MSGHNEKAFHCRRKSWRCDLSGDVRGWDAVCDGEAAGGLVTRKEELPDGIHIEALREPIPHLCHQEPFNCCAKTAASGKHGSSIGPRPVPREMIPTLWFGPVKSKQKPLKIDSKGELTTVSIAGVVRKMSDETQQVFDSLFGG